MLEFADAEQICGLLVSNPAKPKHILTEPGLGYCFTD
jgi:hypothetical protein